MIRKLLTLIIIFFTTITSSAQESNTKGKSGRKTTATKQVSTFTIEAPQLHTAKKIWIYLPQNYNTTEKKYPVMYMHDGQNLFDSKTALAGEWNVDEKLDSLKAQIIVVGIENENEKYSEEHTNKYLEFIVNTLKPEIDTKYKTKPNPSNTAIIGSSTGGLIAYSAILKYPKTFGKAGIFSPDFDASKDIFDKTESIEKIKTKIYFLYGDNENTDMVPNMKKIDYILAGKRCECQHLTKNKMVKGGQHNEKLWRDGFVKAYLWLF